MDGSRRHESRKPHHYHLLTTRSRRSGRVPWAPQSLPPAVFTPKPDSESLGDRERECHCPVIGLIVLVALYRLCVGVVTALVFGAVNPLEHAAFQSIFGEIMTLLIALEFNHTLRYVVTKHQSIIQTKVVVLIALLAVARKFIILDIRDATTGYLLGLAAITLALGATYRLMREPSDP